MNKYNLKELVSVNESQIEMANEVLGELNKDDILASRAIKSLTACLKMNNYNLTNIVDNCSNSRLDKIISLLEQIKELSENEYLMMHDEDFEIDEELVEMLGEQENLSETVNNEQGKELMGYLDGGE